MSFKALKKLFLNLLFRPKLSDNVKIDVLATHDLTHLTFQVVAKGEVVVSKVVDVSHKKQHQIEFAPTLSMVPSAHVVIYYITADGEIISDSLKVEFGNELRNFVSFRMINLHCGRSLIIKFPFRLTSRSLKRKQSQVIKSIFPFTQSQTLSLDCWALIRAFCC